MSSLRPYRVLAIDGGGIRGLLAAEYLRRLEADLMAHGTRLRDCIDLVAGTSTGSILACGLSVGMPTWKLVHLYREHGREIFPYRSRFAWARWRLIRRMGLSAPLYGAGPLRELLKYTLGDRRVADAAAVTGPALLVPFYDVVSGAVQFAKSWAGAESPSAPLLRARLWEVALASSSAPTFFPGFALGAGGRLYGAIDGGVACNNPAAYAARDAVRLAGDRPVRVLSVGTGRVRAAISLREVETWGAMDWLPHITGLLMDAAQDAQTTLAEAIVGEGGVMRAQAFLDACDPRPSAALNDARPGNLRALALAGARMWERDAPGVLEFLEV